VIITNHEYEQYLREAIESVLNQTTTPTEILVVDDAPKDLMAKNITHSYKGYGVNYIKICDKNPLKARQKGFELTKSDYICFLDADDKLDRYYIQGAIQAIQESQAEVIYSDIQYFGDTDKKTNFSKSIPNKRISQTNFLHVGCVTNRKVIIAADAFTHTQTSQAYHEDWYYWRKILKTKCETFKQSKNYNARSHKTNRSKTFGEFDYIKSKGISTTNFSELVQTIIIDEKVDIMLTIDNQEKRIAQNKLNVINTAARESCKDYIFFRSRMLSDVSPSMLGQLIFKLDHNVAMVHNSTYKLFSCTLVITEILKDYYYHDLLDLPFNDNEKIVFYNSNL